MDAEQIIKSEHIEWQSGGKWVCLSVGRTDQKVDQKE